MDNDRRCGMSHLLTLGILQQVQNAGGGDDGVLYDGEMTVGEGPEGFRYGWDDGSSVPYGSIEPESSGWTHCNCDRVVVNMDEYYYFYSDYPDIGNNLAHYEFGGTVYTSVQSLYNYLRDKDGKTISLKVYEDAQ